MLRTLALVSTLASLAVAGAASAQDIRISLDGKDPSVIRAEIKTAAYKVCADALGSDSQHLMPEMDKCVTSTVADAYAQIKDRALVSALEAKPGAEAAISVASAR